MNYNILHNSLNFYNKKGYKEIQVPWCVPKNIINITKPNDMPYFELEYNNYLVGSAEQSFLYLSTIGKIGTDKLYVAITPCFRGDKLDNIHQRYFMKVELFCLNPENKNKIYEKFLSDAFSFFSKYVPVTFSMTIEGTIDIIDKNNKIELGSYSIHHNDKIGYWICGTGVAEPRLSKVLEFYKE